MEYYMEKENSTLKKPNETADSMAKASMDIPANALARLFLKIMAQQNLRGIVYQDMSNEQKLRYANECVLALFVEVGELASSWPFASWKTGTVDIENIEREIIDCVFFLTNIACCFGIEPAALIRRFEIVLANNLDRIDKQIHKAVKY
jgi:dimeric dUTPase (all-alpha-NTP-PPase superfamily)